MHNTIQVTNANELSLPYLNRFFSHAGEISKLTKDENNMLVIIEYKNSNSVQKAFKYNGRVLDKKPITIHRRPLVRKLSNSSDKHIPQLMLNKKMEPMAKNQVNFESFMKLPASQTFQSISNKINYQNFQVKPSRQFKFHNNPLQAFESKQELWKFILYEIRNNVSSGHQSNQELIMELSMFIWSLIQLKLREVKYFYNYKQNQATKYIEMFIQEIIVNITNKLKNENYIFCNPCKIRSGLNDIILQTSMEYPTQQEQQARLLCRSNQKMHNCIFYLYSLSYVIGKIYHQLHGASLIHQRSDQIKQILNKFSIEVEPNLTQKHQKIQYEIFTKEQNEQNFTGYIQNIGAKVIFQELIPYQKANILIWTKQIKSQTQQKPIDRKQQSFPKIVIANTRLQECEHKQIVQPSFLNFYRINPDSLQKTKKIKQNNGHKMDADQNQKMKLQNCPSTSLQESVFKIQTLQLQKQNLIFEQAQFTYQQIFDSTIRYQEYLLYQFQKQRQKRVQSSTKSEGTDLMDREKQDKEADLINISIVLIKHKFQKDHYNSVIKLQKNINDFISNQLCTKEKRLDKVKLFVISEIQSKINQFNCKKCQIYLSNYLDHYIFGKNAIVSSEEFAETLAKELLKNVDDHNVFGFRDYKYIASQIWRLAQKSGQRRTKTMLDHYIHARKKVKQ